MTDRPLAVVIGASPLTGGEHLGAAQRAGCDLAIVDTNPTRAFSCQEIFSAAPYLSLEAMLDDLGRSGRPIEIAVIATPSAFHLRHLIQLATARRNGEIALGGVLLEKPPWLPHENRDADQAISHIEQEGLRVGVGMTTLFDEAFLAVKDTLVSGELGRVLAIEDEIYFQITSDMGLPPNYFHSADKGGSTLVLNGVHSLHRMDYLIGDRQQAGATEAIRRHEYRPAMMSNEFVATNDYGHLQVHYRGGPVADMKVAWTAFPPERSRLHILAENGTATIYGNGDSWKITKPAARGGYEVITRERRPGFNKFDGQFAAIQEWVRTGERPDPLPTLSDLRWTMRQLGTALDQFQNMENASD